MKRASRDAPQTIQEYLQAVPADLRPALEELRKTIRKTAPRAEEAIGYRMPGFRYHGWLVFYAAFQGHGSFFVASGTTLNRFKSELKPFAAGKGTLHFTADHPLPSLLVRRIVSARLRENELRLRTRERKHAGRARKPGSRPPSVDRIAT